MKSPLFNYSKMKRHLETVADNIGNNNYDTLKCLCTVSLILGCDYNMLVEGEGVPSLKPRRTGTIKRTIFVVDTPSKEILTENNVIYHDARGNFCFSISQISKDAAWNAAVRERAKRRLKKTFLDTQLLNLQRGTDHTEISATETSCDVAAGNTGESATSDGTVVYRLSSIQTRFFEALFIRLQKSGKKQDLLTKPRRLLRCLQGLQGLSAGTTPTLVRNVFITAWHQQRLLNVGTAINTLGTTAQLVAFMGHSQNINRTDYWNKYWPRMY